MGLLHTSRDPGTIAMALQRQLCPTSLESLGDRRRRGNSRTAYLPPTYLDLGRSFDPPSFLACTASVSSLVSCRRDWISLWSLRTQTF